MKRINLTAVVLTVLLAGCGTASPAETSSAQTPDTPVPVKTQEPAKKEESFRRDAVIEETVLWDDGSVIITASELTFSNRTADLKLRFENNTDKPLSFVSGSLGYACNSINQYMSSELYVNVDVEPGMKANKTVSISLEELQALGMNTIAEICIGFDISDSNYKDYAQTGPLTLHTSAYEGYDMEEDTFLNILQDGTFTSLTSSKMNALYTDPGYHSSGIDLISAAEMSRSDGSTIILLELKNNSEETLVVRTGGVTLNNIRICSSNWDSDTITPGKTAIMDLRTDYMITDAYREIFGITGDPHYTVDLSVLDQEYDTVANPTTVVLGDAYTGEYDTSGEILYNENGFTVISKGLAKDKSDYSDDLHALFLVLNDSAKTLYADIDYNSVSVNGYMTSFICYNAEIPSGYAGIMDVRLMGSSLDDNDIDSLEDITEVRLKFQFAQDSWYNYVAEPVLTASYGE